MGCLWICIGSGRIRALGTSRKKELDDPLLWFAKLLGIAVMLADVGGLMM
jgi:hypothetical protein